MKVVLDNYLRVPIHLINPGILNDWSWEIIVREKDGTQVEQTVENWVQDGEYYNFFRGDLEKVFKWFPKETIEDKRSWVPWPDLPVPLEFLAELRPAQKEALVAFLRKGGWGILQAPPRWGKTVWLTRLLSVLKQKTLVIAHTIDLVNQAREEFIRWTNVEEIEQRMGTKLVGTTKEGIFPLVTFSTWQSLDHWAADGWLDKHKNDFGIIVVDECHRVTATHYKTIINGFNSYFRIGISATPYHTKSKLHAVEFDTLGPVNTVAKADNDLPITIFVHEVPVSINSTRSWAKVVDRFVNNVDYNFYVARRAYQDKQEGHKVLIITTRIKHIQTLANILEWLDPSARIEKVTGSTPDWRRTEIRFLAKEGKVDYLLATAPVVELGYNVPILSSLHNTIPLTNPENWYQRISRVRTYHPDKKDPVAHIYLPRQSGVRWAFFNMVKKLAQDYKWRIRKPEPLPDNLRRLKYDS